MRPLSGKFLSRAAPMVGALGPLAHGLAIPAPKTPAPKTITLAKFCPTPMAQQKLPDKPTARTAR